MKKIVTLLAAAGMVAASTAPAKALDVNVDGSWRLSFSTASTGFEGDNVTDARQRLRLGVSVAASENLSGYFQFQIGKDRWGTTANTHGNHDKTFTLVDKDYTYDTNQITLRQSYIDWTVPGTAAKVRMGRFALGLPADAVSSNAVISGDWGNKEGVVVTAPVTDNLGLTAMWTRLSADGTNVDENNFSDMFAVAANLKFAGVSGAVYGAYATFDDNKTFNVKKGTSNGTNFTVSAGDAYWVGFTSTLTAFDPFTLALSAAYGSFNADDAAGKDTSGWNVQAKASYKLGFGTPVLAGWYFSGMDDKEDGVMPSVGGYFTPTRTYHDAAKGLNGGIANGLPCGNWGVQAGIEGMSFLSGLSHDFLVTYMQGTNDEDVAKGTWELSEEDSLVSFDLVNTYKIYKNLSAHLEFSYIISDFDGKQNTALTEDDWRAELTFQYKF